MPLLQHLILLPVDAADSQLRHPYAGRSPLLSLSR